MNSTGTVVLRFTAGGWIVADHVRKFDIFQDNVYSWYYYHGKYKK